MKNTKRFLTILLLFTLFSFANSGQENKKESKAKQLQRVYKNYNIALRKKKFRLSLSYALKALDLSITIAGKDSELSAGFYNNLGVAYHKNEKFLKSELNLKKAIIILEKNKKKNLKHLLIFYNNLGKLYLSLKDYKKAEKYFSKAIGNRSSYKTALAADNEKVLQIVLDYCYSVAKQGKLGLAVSYYQQIVLLDLKKDSPLLAYSYYSFAMFFYEDGKYQTAIHFLESARKQIKKHDSIKVSRLQIISKLASCYENSFMNKKANDYFEKALKEIKNSNIYSAYDVAIFYTEFASFVLKGGDANKALFYFEKAGKIFTKNLNKNYIKIIKNINNSGLCFLALGDYKKARKKFYQALSLQNKYFDKFKKQKDKRKDLTLNNLGNSFLYTGDYVRALEFFHKALRLQQVSNEKQFIVSTYNNLASAYLKLKNLSMANKYYKLALDHIEKYTYELKIDSRVIASLYYGFALLKDRQHEYKKALEYYNGSLKLYKLLSIDTENLNVAGVYNSIATLFYHQNKIQDAIKNYSLAYKIRKKYLSKNHPKLAVILNNLSIMYKEISNKDKALEYALASLKILEKGTNADYYIHALANAAELYKNIHDLNSSSELLHKAVDFILKYRLLLGRSKSSFSARYAYIFDSLILLELKKKNYEKAFYIDSQKRGLSISENLSFDNALIKSGVSSKEIKKLKSYVKKIEEFKLQRELAVNKNQMLKADTVLEKIWDTESKKNKLEKKLGKKYPAYRELKFPEPPSISKIKKTLKEEELLISYSFLKNKPVAFVISKVEGLQVYFLFPDESNKDLASKKIENMIRSLSTLLRYPIGKYSFNRKFLLASTKTGEILWNPNLKNPYLLKGDKIYLKTKNLIKENSGFIISPQNKNLKIQNSFIGNFKSDLNAKQAKVYEKKIQINLYNTLLRRILSKREKIKKLIIIPDASLYYLPFSILIQTDKMLLHSYNIKMNYSSIVWYKLRQKKKIKFTYPLLAMGNAVYNYNHVSQKLEEDNRAIVPNKNRNKKRGISADLLSYLNWDNLPETAREVKAIASLAYKKLKEKRKHIFLNTSANVDMLMRLNSKGELKKYRIIHFAAHGLLVDDEPNLNALVLSIKDRVVSFKEEEYLKYKKKFPPLTRDGYLRSGQIKALQISAELVSLSACETSLGLTISGEGMISLPQSFLIAGAKNVLASLWSVDDSSTYLLMKQIYKNIFIKKMLPELALRKAQSNIAELKKYKDPSYWAAFVIYGD